MMFYLFTYLFVTINDNKLMNTEMPYGWSEITYIMIIWKNIKTNIFYKPTSSVGIH